ncbi:MAG: recombinase, partial [Oscillospiraceae bacterium]|nr:recombinase [Oscillospiraceae bacterium]
QTIKIYYKFVGVLSNELHIIPTNRWTALPSRRCQCCGAEYVPGSAAAKYCKPCGKKIHIQQCSESTRRRRAAARKAA